MDKIECEAQIEMSNMAMTIWAAKNKCIDCDADCKNCVAGVLRVCPDLCDFWLKKCTDGNLPCDQCGSDIWDI